MLRPNRAFLVLLSLLLALTGCVKQAAPEPAVIRDGAPPWPAPRDGVSYLDKAGLPQLSLDDRSDPWIVQLTITIDGRAVEVARHIGVDRPRALQAPVHTHDTSGQVWLEGRGNREVTLGQFFTVWGVRFTGQCLGAACSGLTVTADGAPVKDAGALVLRGVKQVTISATTD
ncbi:hypothetical protein ACQB6R_06245 [Propionibacteriaceae bacterium G1746]